MHIAKTASLVSVVAVCYNQSRWLVAALESIRRQTFQNFELVIADDASTDDSTAVATKWLADNKVSATTIFHTQNRGLCRTLNEALSICNGKYLQLVACDDVLREWKLERHVQLLEGLPESVALIHSPANVINGDGLELDEIYGACQPPLSEAPSDAYDVLVNNNNVVAPSVLLRRSVIMQMGLYDERVRIEDWDMWLRIARAGYGFKWDACPSVQYRIHDASMTHKLNEVDMYRVLIKNVGHADVATRLLGILHRQYVRGMMPREWWVDYPTLRAACQSGHEWFDKYIGWGITYSNALRCRKIISCGYRVDKLASLFLRAIRNRCIQRRHR